MTAVSIVNRASRSRPTKSFLCRRMEGYASRSIWSWGVNADGTVGGKAKLIDAADQGSLDGFGRSRRQSGAVGLNGALQSSRPMSAAADVPAQEREQAGRSGWRDGVQPRGQGTRLRVGLPERCANLCFGGPKNNRLYIAKLPLHLRALRGSARRSVSFGGRFPISLPARSDRSFRLRYRPGESQDHNPGGEVWRRLAVTRSRRGTITACH